jgi:hypothetical protein
VSGARVIRSPDTNVPFGSGDLSVIDLLSKNGFSTKYTVKARWEISASHAVINAITPDLMNSPGPTGKGGNVVERLSL